MSMITSTPRPVPCVSVLMPTFEQCAFLPRALSSLQCQSYSHWELIVVDDGSRDDTREVLQPYLADPRIRCIHLHENRGLGAALNIAMKQARGDLLAYLPSDDVYYADHLASLVACLERHPDSVLAYSGVRHSYNRYAPGRIEGYPLQLAQVLHRRTPERWVERSELVTDDLDRMYWEKLHPYGDFVTTARVTCEWVSHPGQRHRVIREPLGGINPFRVRYRVREPLHFHSSVGNRIDEVARYRHLRERPDTPAAPDSLKILLVGELAYNADRILALEERGHRLYGLWTPTPHWYNTVGPLPFGHVEDVPRTGWQDAVRRIQPDVIYALLNWQAVPFAHEVLRDNPGIPFVWHFKEGPFICLENGTWPLLLDLYRRADGRIYCSPETREWFTTVAPDLDDTGSAALVLDGDLPRRAWFGGERSTRLSERDGEPHTVVPGRPIGLHPATVRELARERIHLHVYGDYTVGQWRSWIEDVHTLAPGYLHTHPNVDQEHWVREFSRYDAGWLHYFESRNAGNLRRATWDDLNYPARIATLALAGLPMLQRDNTGAAVASQSLARRLDLGLSFTAIEQLGAQLRDHTAMERVRERVWRQRELFTFDAHADALIAFFRRVINSASSISRRARSTIEP